VTKPTDQGTGPVTNACRAQTPFRFAYISCRAQKPSSVRLGRLRWQSFGHVFCQRKSKGVEGVLSYLESRHTKLYSKQRAFAPIWHRSKLEGNTDLGSRVHALGLSDRPLYYCCQLCPRHAPIKVVIIGKRPRLLKHPTRAGDPAWRIWRNTWRVSSVRQAKMRPWISPQALCHDWPECPSGRDKLRRTWGCLLAVN
jgi:hypothetical protein